MWTIPSSLECGQKKKRKRYDVKDDASNVESKGIWPKVVQIERSPKENHLRRDKGRIQTRSLKSTSSNHMPGLRKWNQMASMMKIHHTPKKLIQTFQV